METGNTDQVSADRDAPILPYSAIVGQEDLKLALELSYISRRIGGVLISGQRGSGKSTAVRSFARMVYGGLPVTLPINATEDRVVGGWSINELMRSKAVWQEGLLQEADGRMLFIDEVNLLDDHIVNIILDCASTGVLVIQREGQREDMPVSFVLVGTMNPEEGGLRPQLLDRFGLMVNVATEATLESRSQILRNVLAFDLAINMTPSESDFIREHEALVVQRFEHLKAAKERFAKVEFSGEMSALCVKIADEFQVEGHRADYVVALAARALAAIQSAPATTSEHVLRVAPMALMHRLPNIARDGHSRWGVEYQERLQGIVTNA